MQLTIVGADGKMGQQTLKAVLSSKKFTLNAAIVHQDSPWIGKDIGELLMLHEQGIVFKKDIEDAFKNSEAVIDFTRPEASVFYAKEAAKYTVIHVIGTTGFNAQQEDEIKKYAQKTVIVKSGNMSLGVNLLAELVKKAALALNADEFDIEISEMHHRYKVDSPSGTALLLGESAAQGRGKALKDLASYDGHGHSNASRQTGTIGFSAQRGGTVIGDHNVIFAGENERLVLSHFAQDRSIFSNGALKAALWAKGKAAGLYSMRDVLGI